jgi:hypothetical protein
MTRGSCLCGAVRFEITGTTTAIGMCHCSKCRKVSGVASNANLLAGRESLRWLSGEDALLKFALPPRDGKPGWRVWRCATCGSPVPHPHVVGEAGYVPAGLLDGDPGVRVAGHIFVGSKAPWDEIADDLPQWAEGFQGERVK